MLSKSTCLFVLVNSDFAFLYLDPVLLLDMVASDTLIFSCPMSDDCFTPQCWRKSLQERLNREQGTGMFVETVIQTVTGTEMYGFVGICSQTDKMTFGNRNLELPPDSTIILLGELTNSAFYRKCKLERKR